MGGIVFFYNKTLTLTPISFPSHTSGIENIDLERLCFNLIVLSMTYGKGCKLILSDTKGGREIEVAFIPQKISDRLKDYIQTAGIEFQSRIFPTSYTAAWSIVVKAGKLVGIHLRPHDLRRHAATYASRSGTPIEIISKIVLRHSNLSTTQRYLGKVSDTEAMRWIENLYG
jgi:integrase